LEAVAELGYQPNRFARSLGRRRTDSIGLLISALRNPFFVDVLVNAEAVALAAGYYVFMDAVSSSGAGINPSKLREWPIDGALMWAEPWQSLEDRLGPQASDTPHVYLGRTDRDDGAAAVGFDLYGGGIQAAEHLVSVGRRRIAFITPHRLYDPARGNTPRDPRYAAYLNVCNSAGLPIESLVFPGSDDTHSAGFAIARKLIERPASERPDAILGLNDLLTIGLCAGLRRAGVRIPDDIAVIGFDHIEEGQFLDTPLTTVSTPTDELCRRGLELLLRAMAGEDLTDVRIVIPAQLVLGGTA
jgi:LacI family transcriptional regulator